MSDTDFPNPDDWITREPDPEPEECAICGSDIHDSIDCPERGGA